MTAKENNKFSDCSPKQKPEEKTAESQSQADAAEKFFLSGNFYHIGKIGFQQRKATLPLWFRQMPAARAIKISNIKAV